KEIEWKLREDLLNEDIKRMTKELEKIKNEEKENLLQDEEEDSKEDAAVAHFETNCLLIARRLKLLIPENK
ncbi:hypothetical protein Anas_02575, partial [Armadillidium nasatum]